MKRSLASVYALGALTSVLVACTTICPDVPTAMQASKPCPAIDAGAPPPPAAATCEGVCAHLAAIGCTAAAPTAEGHTCAEVCRNVQNSGVIVWDLSCRASAATCAAVDKCP